jgi:hypothetical protein
MEIWQFEHDQGQLIIKPRAVPHYTISVNVCQHEIMVNLNINMHRVIQANMSR